MAVSVNYTALSETVSGILKSFQTLDGAIEAANAAAESAVTAVGGETTNVGKAVSSAISTITGSELTKAKEVLTDLANSLGTVAKTYEEEDAYLVGKINNIASQMASKDGRTTNYVN